MTDEDQTTPALQRRMLLRGGAVLAGAAGVGVVGAALNAQTAQAANGQPVLLGTANTETATATVTISNGANPALTLVNGNGPALRLTPTDEDFDGPLAVGDLAGTDLGPLVGVDYGAGAELDYLATGLDLDFVPTPVALEPDRILDTRTAAGRESISPASLSSLDASFRLKAGATIDVAVYPSGDSFELGGAFVNLASVGSLNNGFLSAYPPGPRPASSTLNYRTGVSIANGALVALLVVGNDYVLRIYSSQVTHVILDLSGLIASGVPDAAAAKNGPRAQRARRQAKRAAELRKGMTRR